MSKRGWDVYRAEKLLAVFHYETLRSLSFSCLTVMQQFVTFWQTTTCCQLSEHMKHKTQGKYWLWCFTIVRLKKLNCAFASLILWCQCSPSLSLSVKKIIIILCNRGSLDHYSLNLTRVHYQTMTERFVYWSMPDALLAWWANLQILCVSLFQVQDVQKKSDNRLPFINYHFLCTKLPRCL